jgi:signal peptidase II
VADGPAQAVGATTSSRRARLRPARAYAAVFTVAAVVVGVDQATKQIALDNLDHPVDVIKGVLTLRLTFNSGGAFGVLQRFPGLFLVATFVIVGVIVVLVGRVHDSRLVIPMGMILGGGVGNVADRLFRSLGAPGRVVDFIDFHVWPVFNVADSAIVIGLGLILVLGRRSDRRDSLQG